MKKIFAVVAIVATMILSASCGNRAPKAEVEAVDSTLVVNDSTVVTSDSLAVATDSVAVAE